MSNRQSGLDTNVPNILASAPDIDALDEGELAEIELFPAELEDGSMTVAIEVSRGLTLSQKLEVIDRAEDIVDKRKLKEGQTLGAAYVDPQGELREIAIKEKYQKPSH